MSAPFKLSVKNYHSHEADLHYFNNTQIKRFRTCPAFWHAVINGLYLERANRPESDQRKAFLHGQYVDNALLESELIFKRFCDENRKALFYKGGSSKLAEVKRLDFAIEKVKQDEYFMSRLEGRHQVTIALDDFFGFPVRCKIDNLNLDQVFFTDLKTVRGVNYGEYCPKVKTRLNWLELHEYQVQIAFYRALIKEKYKVDLTGYIDGMEKKEPYWFDVWDITTGKEDLMSQWVTKCVEDMKKMTLVRSWSLEDVDRCEQTTCEYCSETRELKEPRIYQPNPSVYPYAKED